MEPKQHTIPLHNEKKYEKITILTTNLATNICCELDSNGRQLPGHVMALLTIHFEFQMDSIRSSFHNRNSLVEDLMNKTRR